MTVEDLILILSQYNSKANVTLWSCPDIEFEIDSVRYQQGFDTEVVIDINMTTDSEGD